MRPDSHIDPNTDAPQRVLPLLPTEPTGAPPPRSGTPPSDTGERVNHTAVDRVSTRAAAKRAKTYHLLKAERVVVGPKLALLARLHHLQKLAQLRVLLLWQQLGVLARCASAPPPLRLGRCKH